MQGHAVQLVGHKSSEIQQTQFLFTLVDPNGLVDMSPAGGAQGNCAQNGQERPTAGSGWLPTCPCGIDPSFPKAREQRCFGVCLFKLIDIK